jgi:hypothetical protein
MHLTDKINIGLGWKDRDFQNNGPPKQVDVAILMSDKIGLKPKLIRRSLLQTERSIKRSVGSTVWKAYENLTKAQLCPVICRLNWQNAAWLLFLRVVITGFSCFNVMHLPKNCCSSFLFATFYARIAEGGYGWLLLRLLLLLLLMSIVSPPKHPAHLTRAAFCTENSVSIASKKLC